MRPSIRLALVVVSVGFAAETARGDRYPRQPGVDVRHYVFRLELDDATSEIRGEATVEFRTVADGVGTLTLDLQSTTKDGKGMKVESVAVGGSVVAHAHEDDRLAIPLDPPLKAGETRSVSIRYRGTPTAGLRIGKNRHGDRSYFSENWPDKARRWLPTLDHPYDKATSEFVVTAPASYQVVSNGLLREETDLGDGRRTTHWRQSVPIATWLNALAVAPFASRHGQPVRGIPIQTWVFRQDRDKLIPALEASARSSAELFWDRIGPYPYEKIAGVQAVGFDGGMELAGAVFYGQNSLGGPGVPALVAHETAHQWFGDSVTESDWNEVWLSEGFATFLALVHAEHTRGPAAYRSGLERARSTVFGYERRDAKTAVIHADLTDMEKVLNPLVYQKGGWFLHMLRRLVGEEAFWSGMKTYYARHRDKNATTADFRKAMEETSKTDLGWFFDQWLRRPGSPKVEGTWRRDPAAKLLKVTLTQTQPGAPYRLPLEIAATFPGAAAHVVHRIELTERTRVFEFPADAEPSAVVLDPDLKVLMSLKFGKE